MPLLIETAKQSMAKPILMIIMESTSIRLVIKGFFDLNFQFKRFVAKYNNASVGIIPSDAFTIWNLFIKRLI